LTKHCTEFLNDIESDISLFKKIKEEIDSLDLLFNDSKRIKIIETIENIISQKESPKRKVIVFTEYLDTLKSLKPYFKEKFKERVLFSEGNLTVSFNQTLNQNFNAQYQGNQKDDYDVLLTSDKLSEGVNLNRAGTIINYDIPWNPTRVIQRVGRINRIGMKVFDELYIYNFFPSERGADIVKSREIAANKMFLIHSALGEDSKIFALDEEPTPSELFKRMNKNPEEDEEISLVTIIRNRYEELKEKYPDIIKRVNGFPLRIKTAKSFNKNELLVLRKKGLSLFIEKIEEVENPKSEIMLLPFEKLLTSIECKKEEPRLNLSNTFWNNYERMKNYKPTFKSSKNAQSLETKALSNLHSAVKVYKKELEPLLPFILVLLKDLKEYQTLTKYSLRRLTKFELDSTSNKETVQNFIREITWLKNHLGENYLEQISLKAQKNKTEVIVAVENIKE